DLEFLVLRFQAGNLAGIPLTGGLFVAVLLAHQIGILAELARLPLLTEVGKGRRVETFASQQSAELSGLMAGIGLGEDTQFVGGGEASSGSPLEYLGIGATGRWHASG